MDKIHFRKGQLSILIFNLCALLIFSVHFFLKNNYEFVIYIGVITFFILVILITSRKVHYPNIVLWGLTTWAVMHMAGGALHIGGTRLYEIMIYPLSENYPVFRYDQLVHIIGFGMATATMFYVLKPILRPDIEAFVALSVIVIAAGLGVGAVNEILEFLVAVVVPESGVGGYVNTSLDLVSDLIGAALAMFIIRINIAKKMCEASTDKN